MLQAREDNQEDTKILLDKASELAGDDFTARYQLYIAFSQLGDEERAQRELDKINEIQQMFMEAQEALEASAAETEEVVEDNTEE